MRGDCSALRRAPRGVGDRLRKSVQVRWQAHDQRPLDRPGLSTIVSSIRPSARSSADLGDALILLALTAIGSVLSFICIQRAATNAPPTDAEYGWWLRDRACRCFAFMLLAWTVAFVPLRLRNPRPHLRYLCRRLGGSSCFCIIVVAITLYCERVAVWCLWLLIPDEQLGAHGIEPKSPWTELAAPIEDLASCAAAVIVATWLILAATYSVKPKGDWVDIVGFALGVGWMTLSLAKAVCAVLDAFA